MPEAAERLLAAATYWDRLEHLTISNVSFPVPPTLDASTSRPLSIPPLLPAALPGLQTITISQATALSPLSIASLLAMKDPGMDALTRVRLVDTYEISIWGKRLRRGDVEQAAERRVLAQGQGAEEIMRAVKRVRSVVICEARLERIIGGDRVEGTTVLE